MQLCRDPSPQLPVKQRSTSGSQGLVMGITLENVRKGTYRRGVRELRESRAELGEEMGGN